MNKINPLHDFFEFQAILKIESCFLNVILRVYTVDFRNKSTRFINFSSSHHFVLTRPQQAESR